MKGPKVRQPQAVRRAQAVLRRPRAEWRGLALACGYWVLALIAGAAIVYGIAVIPSGWWMPGGLQW